MLHVKFHADQDVSNSQLISSCHHQSLAANADEMRYNYDLFSAMIQQWLDTLHSQSIL